VYKQAPFEPVNEVTYKTACDKMPILRWDKLPEYEKEDNTKASQTFACVGGQCEIVDTVDN